MRDGSAQPERDEDQTRGWEDKHTSAGGGAGSSSVNARIQTFLDVTSNAAVENTLSYQYA